MKKLERKQMKKFMGGFAMPPSDSLDGGELTCNAACVGSSGPSNGNLPVSGTCSKKTVRLGNVTSQICVCSVSNGNGC